MNCSGGTEVRVLEGSPGFRIEHVRLKKEIFQPISIGHLFLSSTEILNSALYHGCHGTNTSVPPVHVSYLYSKLQR